MMNRSLFVCALLANCTMHCMEQNNQIAPQNDNPWKRIDISLTEKALKDDSTNYLSNRLAEYKKTDFSLKDMEHINTISLQITGKPDSLIYNKQYIIRDNENNTFLHIAIQKLDLPVATWLLKNKYWIYSSNHSGKTPIDLCIEQLLPTAEEKNKNTQVASSMLNVFITEYKKASCAPSVRKSFITKLIALEFAHQKAETNFALKDSWLQAFLSQGRFSSSSCYSCGLYKSPKKCSACFNLKDFYPTIKDAEKNSYTHILVQKHCADQLYDFIQKEYVSFTPNNEGKNPLDIALELFNLHYQTDSSAERCCLFMLLNYVKKQQGITDFVQCCNKHTI